MNKAGTIEHIALLGSTTRVETPIISVDIGGYTFGVHFDPTHDKANSKFFDKDFPNFIKSLTVQKINGQVNMYTLALDYPITPNDDPNFMEKIFSSISETRKIIFSYGDASVPTYIYKKEQAIVTNVTLDFNVDTPVLSYTINAVSSARLAMSGCFNFPYEGKYKPSDLIKQVFANSTYGLSELFYGMDTASLEKYIPGDDAYVDIHAKTQIAPLDYILYLVECMVPASNTGKSLTQPTFYVLTIHDDISKSDEDGEQDGPYFKISNVTKAMEKTNAYTLDIGYPSANIVTKFRVNNNESYSIFYKWNEHLTNQRDTVKRLDITGNNVERYAPTVSSRGDTYYTTQRDQTWWSKVTEYPISATLELKGLLRPAVLMDYVRVNVYFFGKKHINSGLYIVTKQVDQIDSKGYRTTLSLTRIGGDKE